MIKKIKELLNKNKSIILYLIFGVLSTILNIVAYTVCIRFFNMHLVISNIIAWIFAVTFAFFTNKIFVFESNTSGKRGIIREMILFYYYRIVSLLIETVLLYIFVDILNINDLIMKVITNIIVIILNYFFSKFKIFKNSVSRCKE